MSKEGTVMLLEQIVDLLNDYSFEENEIRNQIKVHIEELSK